MPLSSYAENRPVFITALARSEDKEEIEIATKNVKEWEKDDPYFMYFDWVELALTHKLFNNLIRRDDFPEVFYEAELAERSKVPYHRMKGPVKDLLTYFWSKGIITSSGGQLSVLRVPILTESFQGEFGMAARQSVTISFASEEIKGDAVEKLGRRFCDNMYWLKDADDIKKEFSRKGVVAFSKMKHPVWDPNDKKASLGLPAKSVFSELLSDIILSAYGTVEGEVPARYVDNTRSTVNCLLEHYKSVLPIWSAIRRGKFSDEVVSGLEPYFDNSGMKKFLETCNRVYSEWKPTGLAWVK